MVLRAPSAIAHPPVLRPDRETLAQLASVWSKPLDLDMCPMPTSLRQFCCATDKPKPAWFWGTNQETVAVILRPKSPNCSCWFWGSNRETLHHLGFEAQIRNRCHRFWGQITETVPVVLRPNHWQTIDLGFEAQPRNPRTSSPRAWCKLHTVPPDLSINRPLSTWHVRPSPILCTRSSTPATILVTVRHAAPAAYTPREKQTRFSKRTKDKGKTTEPSRIRIQTLSSQWFITIKPRSNHLVS
jgi:hypothetical protein